MSEHDNFSDTSTGAGRPADIPTGGEGAEWSPPPGTALPAQRPEPNAEQPPVGAPASEASDATTEPASGTPPFGTPPFGTPPFGTPPFGTPPFGTPPFGDPASGTRPYGAGPYGTPPFGTHSYAGSGAGGVPPSDPGTGWGYVPWNPGVWSPGPHGPSSPSRGRSTMAIVVVAALLAAFLGVVIGHAAWQPSASSINSAFQGNGSSGNSGNSGGSPFGSSTPSTGGGPANAGAIAARVDPELVDVNTVLSYQNDEAAGTGMVLTSNGEVLTNNHVIEGATSISVTDIGNGKTYGATVVGYDRTHDVAVLQLKGASGLQTISTADSSKVRTGQDVVGVGNAGGRGGTPSYAGGTITALDQTITASDASDNSTEQLTGLLQDDANIQPGDSGGPLVNTSGQVIGMDTAASQGFSFQSSGTAQGYAIPINQALSVARQIETDPSTTGDVHIGPTAFLGVEVQGTSSSSNPFGGFGNFGGPGFNGGGGANGRGQASTSGALIVGVISGSPADQAGLAQGDTITAVAGHPVSSPNSLTTVMIQESPNASVPLTYVDSAGQQYTVTVHLTAGPPQ
jgi:S1-C subfamily serine protease